MGSCREMRAESVMDNIKIHLGELFWDWGIPTAVSIIEVRRALKYMPIIASGGLRNGLDFAKCLALDASMCAMAYPFLRHAGRIRGEAFRICRYGLGRA